MSDVRLEAWRLFITLHSKIIERIDAALQKAGELPLQHYDVLIELFEAEGKELRMYELAERVVLSRSSITRLVDQLAKEGLLTRRTDPQDRRGSFAVLTPAGETALRESWPLYRDAIQRYFGAFLSDEEAEMMARIFGRIHEAVNSEGK